MGLYPLTTYMDCLIWPKGGSFAVACSFIFHSPHPTLTSCSVRWPCHPTKRWRGRPFPGINRMEWSQGREGSDRRKEVFPSTHLYCARTYYNTININLDEPFLNRRLSDWRVISSSLFFSLEAPSLLKGSTFSHLRTYKFFIFWLQAIQLRTSKYTEHTVQQCVKQRKKTSLY